jgi:Mg/Co/Ni transporter MgtE
MSGRFALAQQFVEVYPQAAARVLESAAPVMASTFIDAVPDKNSSSLLASMLPYHAGKCVSQLSPDVAARYIAELEPRIAVGILRYVPAESRDAILENIPRRAAARIFLILNYSRSMVGAWVDPTVLSLPADCSIGEARLRLKQEGYADFHRIYVVNEAHALTGCVRLVRLIQAEETHRLAEHLEPAPPALSASASLDAALGDSGWLENDYLPVLDRRNKFLGVLRYAALRTAASQPLSVAEDRDVSGTFMDLAESYYLGLADIMSTSLAIDKPAKEAGSRRNGDA